MSQQEMVKVALAVGMLYAVYKFAPHPAAKTGAVAVAAVVIARRLPVLKDQLS